MKTRPTNIAYSVTGVVVTSWGKTETILFEAKDGKLAAACRDRNIKAGRRVVVYWAMV